MGLFDGKRCEKALLRAARGETAALSELYDLLSRQIYTLAYGIPGVIVTALAVWTLVSEIRMRKKRKEEIKE